MGSSGQAGGGQECSGKDITCVPGVTGPLRTADASHRLSPSLPPSRSTYCAHSLCLAPAQGQRYSRDRDRGRVGPKEQQAPSRHSWDRTPEPEPPLTTRAVAAGAGLGAGQEHPASFSQLPFRSGGGSERPRALPGVTQPGEGPRAGPQVPVPTGAAVSFFNVPVPVTGLCRSVPRPYKERQCRERTGVLGGRRQVRAARGSPEGVRVSGKMAPGPRREALGGRGGPWPPGGRAPLCAGHSRAARRAGLSHILSKARASSPLSPR